MGEGEGNHLRAIKTWSQATCTHSRGTGRRAGGRVENAPHFPSCGLGRATGSSREAQLLGPLLPLPIHSPGAGTHGQTPGSGVSILSCPSLPHSPYLSHRLLLPFEVQSRLPPWPAPPPPAQLCGKELELSHFPPQPWQARPGSSWHKCRCSPGKRTGQTCRGISSWVRPGHRDGQ